MGNLGGMEVVVILLVALVVLGPKKLPYAARQVGRALTELKRISGGFQKEMREAMQDPIVEAEARAEGARVVASESVATTADTAVTGPPADDSTAAGDSATDDTATDDTAADSTEAANDDTAADNTEAANDDTAADNTEAANDTNAQAATP